jgi:hypothetical protein
LPEQFQAQQILIETSGVSTSLLEMMLWKAAEVWLQGLTTASGRICIGPNGLPAWNITLDNCEGIGS